MRLIGQKINMGFYGKRQRSPTKNGQVVKPQEPTSLREHPFNLKGGAMGLLETNYVSKYIRNCFSVYDMGRKKIF